MFLSRKSKGVPRPNLYPQASMGPGCFYPGNAASIAPSRLFPALQWGRDVSIPEMRRRARRFWRWRSFNGAGMFLSRKCDWVKVIGGLRAMLQWGRDVSIPEIVRAGDVALERCGFNGAGMFLSRKWYPSSFSRRKPSCFNGAGMFLSRKSRWGGDVPIVRTPASMGPGCFYPGNSGHHFAIAVPVRASMGPGCFYPGNPPPRPRPPEPTSSFNGAGMFLSRKFRGRVPRAASVPASMGPGCFYPGNFHKFSKPFLINLLQWGRDVSIPEMPGQARHLADLLQLQWGRDVSIPEMTREFQ